LKRAAKQIPLGCAAETLHVLFRVRALIDRHVGRDTIEADHETSSVSAAAAELVPSQYERLNASGHIHPAAASVHWIL
jgi:hypothetical protein